MQAVFDLFEELDVVQLQLVVDQPHGFIDNLFQIDLFRSWMAGPGELEQVFDDFTGPIGLVHGLLVKVPTLRRVHFLPVFKQCFQNQ